MAATESNRRSASLKISALPFCGDSQKHPVSIKTRVTKWPQDAAASLLPLIAAYGELVDEQCGKDEILLEEAQVEP